MAKKPYRYALLEVIAQEMRADKNMCFFYEYQNPSATLPDGTVLHLAREFGNLRTSGNGWPLDEAWYVGMATGMTASGIRVVLELPSMTTVYPFEYIFNQVGNFRMMTGGQYNMPMTIILDGAARAGGSAQQHSQVGQEALYSNVPGIKVVVPSDAYTVAGLMRAATHYPDPVIMFNYAEAASGEQPDIPDQPFEVEIGKAMVRQEGKDLTLVTWAPATVDVNKALPELAKAGLSIEYIDMLSIKPWDTAAVIASAKKTGRVLVVEHGYYTGGFSATVLAEIAQKAPGVKAARIAFPDAAGPAAREMILWLRPDAPKIIDAVPKMMKA
jgi:pyruvate/2-oxoglutarate/acetoin dehydrogenase E1 component